MASSHDNQIATTLVGSIDDRIVRMVVRHDHGLAAHADPIGGLLNEGKEARGASASLLMGLLPHFGVHPAFARAEQAMVLHDVNPSDFRPAQFGELDAALDCSFGMI